MLSRVDVALDRRRGPDRTAREISGAARHTGIRGCRFVAGARQRVCVRNHGDADQERRTQDDLFSGIGHVIPLASPRLPVVTQRDLDRTIACRAADQPLRQTLADKWRANE